MSSSAHSALASLTANYTDSEPEEGSDQEESGTEEGKDEPGNAEDVSESPVAVADEYNSRDAQSVSSAGDSTSGGSRSKANNALGLVSYHDDLIDDDVVDDFDHNSDSLQDDATGRADDADSSGSALDDGSGKQAAVDLEDISQDNKGLEGDDVLLLESKKVRLPPEPSGKCPSELQDKFTKLYERKVRRGLNINDYIQSNKQFRNPSIYEKLIIRCNIDELGTNYPKHIYDPHIWDESSYYDELAKAQKTEMERREKDRKERTKVEFVSGTVKKTAAAPPPSGPQTEGEQKRKSKWDQKGVMPVFPAVISAPTVQPVVVQPPFTANASGTKGTVINAFGSLPKKSKM